MKLKKKGLETCHETILLYSYSKTYYVIVPQQERNSYLTLSQQAIAIIVTNVTAL